MRIKFYYFYYLDDPGPDSSEDINGGSPTDADADDDDGGEGSSSDQENILVLDVLDDDKDKEDMMDVAKNENSLTTDIPTESSDEITDTIIQISTSENRQVSWSIFHFNCF